MRSRYFYSTAMNLKFSANLSFIFQESSSLIERYALAKRNGFTGVEVAFPYDTHIQDIVDAKDESGMEQVLINVYPGEKGEMGFAALPGREKEFQDSIGMAVTYAKALNCSRIHVMAGVTGEPTELHDKTYESNIRYAVELFKKENLTALLEPINPFSLPGYYLSSFEKAVSLIEKVSSPNLKLMLDLYHLQLIHGNLTHNIKRLLPHTSHIQIAQAPERHEPDSEGEICYRYIFQLLDTLNYQGWIGCEYKPLSTTEAGLKWMTSLAQLSP